MSLTHTRESISEKHCTCPLASRKSEIDDLGCVNYKIHASTSHDMKCLFIDLRTKVFLWYKMDKFANFIIIRVDNMYTHSKRTLWTHVGFKSSATIDVDLSQLHFKTGLPQI